MTDTKVQTSLVAPKTEFEEAEKIDKENSIKATACVISTFAKPPFDEYPILKGEPCRSIVSIPFIVEKLLRDHKLQTQEEPAGKEFTERIELSKKELEAILGEILEYKNYHRFVDDGWISQEEIDFMQEVIKGSNDTISLVFRYPPSAILDTYLESITNPNSHVMLGGFNVDGDFILERLTSGNKSQILYPGLSSRIGAPKPEDAITYCQDQLDFYLHSDTAREILDKLGVVNGVSTIFAAEINKTPEVPDERVLFRVTTAYFKDVVEKPENLPKQVVSYTYNGTPIYDHGLLPMATLGVKQVGGDDKYFYTEETMDVKTPNGTLRVIVLKLNEKKE